MAARSMLNRRAKDSAEVPVGMATEPWCKLNGGSGSAAQSALVSGGIAQPSSFQMVLNSPLALKCQTTRLSEIM